MHHTDTPRGSALRTAVRRHRRSLVVLGVAAGGLWGFLELADEVVEGSTAAFDSAILLALRNPDDAADPLGPWWVEYAMRDITVLGGVAVLTLITIASVVFMTLARLPRAAMAVLAAIVTGVIISTALKYGFDRARPDIVGHGAQFNTASFPSGHSMMSAVVYLTLGAVLARVVNERRLRIFVLGTGVFLTLIVGFSRVYLGVHWPSDVLAGWTLGAVWALVCSALMLRLQITHAIEATPDAASGDPPRPNRDQ